MISERDYFVMRRPVDPHVHLRQGEMMITTMRELANYYQMVFAMPNIAGRPIRDEVNFEWYRAQVKEAQALLLQERLGLEVRYYLYLTDDTGPAEVEFAKRQSDIVGFKCYLAGTTTNSAEGVRDLLSPELDKVFDLMSDWGVPLSIHLEEPGVPDLEAEEASLWRLEILRRAHPRLVIVMEHVSTRAAVEMVEAMDHTYATITIQHVTLTTEDALANPHNRCKPIAKSEDDRKAVLHAALSGNPKFMMGNDTAGHPRTLKEQADESKRPSGIWNAPTAFSVWVDVFELAGKTPGDLENFALHHAARLHGLLVTDWPLAMLRESWDVPDSYGKNLVVPFLAGQTLDWQASR